MGLRLGMGTPDQGGPAFARNKAWTPLGTEGCRAGRAGIPAQSRFRGVGVTLCQTKGDALLLIRFVYKRGDRHPIGS